MKLAAALRVAGVPLPDEVARWIDQCKAVKHRYRNPMNERAHRGLFFVLRVKHDERSLYPVSAELRWACQ